MELQLLDLLRGYVRIRITGNSYDRFLNLCAFHGIRLWELSPSGESYEAFVSIRDFKKLRTIVRKSHTGVAVLERRGLPFFMHRYRRRKWYLAGIAAAFVFMLWLSAHVWNISVDGNVSQTEDVIFEYLQGTGVRCGMRRSGVDCKELAAQLRNYFTQFAWVAAELRGTRLLIHVREGVLTEEENREKLAEEEPSSLAASCSGTVVSIYTRSGRPLVQAGDAVEKGQVLVSGALPIYDDSGAVKSWRHVAADADVVIRSTRRYRDSVSMKTKRKQFTGRERTARLLQIGGFALALPSPFGALAQYDLLTETVQLQPLKNFYLPVYLQKFTAREYETTEGTRTREEAQRELEANFQYFLKKLAEKGVQIFENDVKIKWNEKSAIASGTLTTGETALQRTAVARSEEELPSNEYG